MADNSSLSWSESASTLQHRRSNSGYSSSRYSTDSQSDKESQCSTSSSTTPWVIDHLLESSLPDELPLRVMFSFNSGQALPSVVQAHKYWHFEKEGRKIIQFLSSLEKITPSIADATDLDLQNPAEERTDFLDPHCPYDRFMDPGNENLLKVKFDPSLARRASQGLPPEIVRKLLLTNMFRANFEDVDWQQALAGLDYLRDLEETRKCSQREATSRLKITGENWSNVLCENPGAMAWVERVLDEESCVEGYYARISVNLRLWTMINELRQPNFYKPNILAMLNTLFPPSMGEPPKGHALPKALHRHRATFYHIMLAVESGKRKPLEEFAGKLRIGTSYSWPETRLQLEKYLDLAEAQIVDARLIEEIESVPPVPELSPQRTSGPRSSPFTTPSGSFDGQKSLSGSPRLTSKSSFRKGHHRNLSKTIFLRDLDPNEPKAIRSAPLADRTPNLRRPTSSGSGFDTGAVGSSGTFRSSTQSGSPQKPVTHEELRFGSFEATTPEPAFLTSPEYADIENFKPLKSPMMSTPVNPYDPYELRHRRTNSSGKVKQGHSEKPGMERPFLRRDSSALKNVESIEDIASQSIGRPYEDNPLPSSNPPKLSRKSSFGERLLRKVKSTTSLKDQPAKGAPPVSRRGPPLTHMNSGEVKEPDAVQVSQRRIPSFSKNDTFGRRSLYSRRVSGTKVGNGLGILFGASSESITQHGQDNKSPRVFTPQERNNSFTALKNRSTPNLRHPERQSSELKPTSIQATSSPVFGIPIGVNLQQPFMSYKLPILGDNIDTFADPSLRIRKQKSTSFLSEMRKSRIKTPKPEISEFAASPFIGLDAAVKNKLKKKSSMPTLAFFSTKKPKALEIVVPETPKERAIILQTKRSTKSLRKSISPTKSTSPPPPTPTLTTPAQRIRLTKSQSSLNTAGSIPPKPAQNNPSTTPVRKLLRKLSREKIITSADITEPFPEALRKSFSSQASKATQNQFAKRSKEYDMPAAITSPELYNLPPYAPGGTGSLTKNYIPPTNESLEDFHRKEYTRKWFLEESRARRHELGEPRTRLQVEEMEEMGLKRLRREEWPRVEGRNGKRKEEGKKGWFEFAGWAGKREG